MLTGIVLDKSIVYCISMRLACNSSCIIIIEVAADFKSCTNHAKVLALAFFLRRMFCPSGTKYNHGKGFLIQKLVIKKLVENEWKIFARNRMLDDKIREGFLNYILDFCCPCH